MAVYTTLSLAQVNELISRFDLPLATSLIPASSGIENTTYFLELEHDQQLVLTLFEMLDAKQLPFFISLLQCLARSGLPVPAPLLDKSQQALQHLVGKPALLFPKITGRHDLSPDHTHCAMIGRCLANIHLAARNLSDAPVDPNGIAWLQHTAELVKDSLNATDHLLLQQQLTTAVTLSQANLPTGIIHGDLFRDNVLFNQEGITAVIDFYNAGRAPWLLDLAIVVNDWCYHDIHVRGADSSTLALEQAVLNAYGEVRPFTPDEQRLWPAMLRYAALRLWLSRLNRVAKAKRGGRGQIKDPEEYRSLLLYHLKSHTNDN